MDGTPIEEGTPIAELVTSWLPLFLTAVLPLLCMPFVALGVCGNLTHSYFPLGGGYPAHAYGLTQRMPHPHS